MKIHPSATRGALAAALFAASGASAQSDEQLPGFNLERLETNMGRGTLLVGNGELMVPGGYNISLLGHYQRMPLSLSDGEQDLQVVRDRATALLSGSYSVLSWLEVGAQVPFVLWQQGDDPTQVGLSQLSAQGIGTPVLQVRLGLLSRRQRKPVDLAADLGVGLPFGSETALAGDTGPRFHARMVAGTSLGALNSSLEAGVLFRPAIRLATPDGAAKPGAVSEVRLAAALSTTGEGLRGEMGLRATLSPQVSMDLLAGVRFPMLIGLDAFILGGPGLGGAPGAPRFRMLAGVSFTSEPPPRLSYLDEHADRELQLQLATPAPEQKDDRVRAVSTWELNSLTRGEAGSAGPGAQAEPVKPYEPGPGERVALRGDVYFAQGSGELQGVVALLDQVVLRLAELPKGGTVIIEGHADTEGTGTSNRVISYQRALAVRRYLIDQGVLGTQIRLRGFGADWPISANPATEQERQLNRRASVLVVTPSETPATAGAPVP